MSLPSQTEVVLRLAELSRLLDAATVEVAQLDEAAVRAKQTHEVASAKAYLTAEGPVLRGSEFGCECLERIRTLGVQLDVGRTLSAAIRNQFQAEPVGQYT